MIMTCLLDDTLTKPSIPLDFDLKIFFYVANTIFVLQKFIRKKKKHKSQNPNGPLLGNTNLLLFIFLMLSNLIFQRGSAAFSDPSKFGCYLVMDPSSQISVNCALRYWGCTIQAGAQISGAFGISPPTSSEELAETVKNNFSPLSFALIPRLSMDSPLDWNAIMRDDLSREARNILSVPASIMSSVKFDSLQKAVTLLMPGFNKSEIRLYQVCHFLQLFDIFNLLNCVDNVNMLLFLSFP